MILIDQMETLRRLLKKQIELQNKHLERTLWYHGLTEAIEEVQKMPVVTVNVNEWISVKDKLPNIGIEVLVATRTKKGFRAVDKGYYWDDRWVHRGTSEVTHWMPRPELPEEDKA